MDGLSAAASGIAVVSLAVQLIGSVRDIRRFLRRVSEAPKELKQLIDLLEQLELVLQNIGMVIENQRKHNDNGDIDVSLSVLRAIEACESKVTILEGVIEATKKASSTRNKTARTLVSFKLTWKKREINEFESQLHDTVNLLNLAMTANLTTLYSKGIGQLLSKVNTTNRIAATITDELLTLHSSPVNLASKSRNWAYARLGESHESPERFSGAKIQRSQSMTFSSFTCPFGKLFVTRIMNSADFDNGDEILFAALKTKTTNTWIFVPSFASACVNYQYMNTCGFVQRSIRIYPLIPSNHPIWDLCYNGDLKGIQTLLNDGQVSPFSVNRRGNTLLHSAASYSMVETCRFFFNIGLTGKETNIYGFRPCMHALSEPGGIPDLRDTNALFASRCGEIDITIQCYNLFSQHWFEPTLQIFNDMVNEFVSKETVNRFRETPIAMAMKMLWSSDSALYDEWKKIICHLIELGANLNKGGVSEMTPLDYIMNLVGRPFDSIYLGKEWLDILSISKIDLVEYLRTEFRLHFARSKSLSMLSPDSRSDYRPRYLVISEKIPSLSWEWFIDPDGQAFDLLDEFKDFGPIVPRYSDIDLDEEGHHWPLVYPVWEDCLGIKFFDPEMINRRRVAEARFENRRHKKAKKLARACGISKIPEVPGSWID